MSNRAGRRAPSWWARRRAEKLRLRKQAELDKRELQLKDIELAKAHDAYEEEKVARADAAKESKAAAARAAVRARWRAFRNRIADDRPLLAAVVMAGVCLVVEFVGQLMFYGDLNWPTVLLFMPVLLSMIVTGATWTFAINADYLTGKGLSAAADIRKMWYWSTAAAIMNGYHGVVRLHELSVGIVLGSASLVGPYIWHRYVTLQKVAKSGRTADQIRAALLRRLFHPFLWRRAVDLWAAADGAMTASTAWRITWAQVMGAAPGTPRAGAVTPARNQWLFRLVFGRVVSPPSAAVVSAPPARSPRHSEALQKRAEERSITGAAVSESAQGTLADATITAGIDCLMLDVEQWLKGASDAPATDEKAAPEALTEVHQASSGAVSGADERHLESASDVRDEERSSVSAAHPEASAPRSSRSARHVRRSARHARQDFTALVTAYFEKRLAAGARADEITGPEAAQATGASEQHARKVLAKLRKKQDER
ncbi:hypothetical protein BBK82_03520 [Lentzea guizhouensis]|uniref:DUF2637 domain-containing protein n=1 Tax=Lentzea guizhouensis TaxID=1586287 RepID=A0A1B2HC40_9PSEU|nr:hypothetical protein [Lentzea guizhouensis]ANZ35285.1 hypothetical protein BBK82_03520 [Lentzea guizhouensis]